MPLYVATSLETYGPIVGIYVSYIMELGSGLQYNQHEIWERSGKQSRIDPRSLERIF